MSRGRLFEVHPQVYAIGAPDLGNEGEWIAAVFACGEGALLSHRSAGALWGLVPWRGGLIDVSVPARRNPRPRGVRVHRRTAETFEVSSLIDRIAVTSVIQTFIDLATELGDDEIHGAVREEIDWSALTQKACGARSKATRVSPEPAGFARCSTARPSPSLIQNSSAASSRLRGELACLIHSLRCT